ncbi:MULTISPECIES: helix-turn-helix domain-containing protein [Kitasatospora]|uniref:Glycerol operon regulatory protein n=1 Tax=Kitasatospora setae (strain ATCC 33774 / DSM 43861 / JCM 3304 / KCC A-0304 / NBRC 14216 / KM-6054) TaxID=452652 RepID=E4NEI6_KITSK|nr:MULTISPECIES: helix-turn-helix domain-containing protein [Kitasatospora]BAJ29772.1 putative IclR family transcriptional regulator [Kitasatospora setae KM-6054]
MSMHRIGQPAGPGAATAAEGDIRAPRAPTLITSVQRALRLLEAVGSHVHGATAKQLARCAGLPLGTTYHLLRTLTHEGYLRREGGRFYYGASVDGISRADTRQAEHVDLRGRMEELRDELGAAVYYAVYEDGEVLLVDAVSGAAQPQVEEWADFRATAHAHAIGLCLLSQLGTEERLDHLSRHRPAALTPSTSGDVRSVLRRLERVRPTMPVLERQEYALGTVCAAVPITVGSVVATMAISLPLEQAERLGPAAARLRSLVGAMFPAFVRGDGGGLVR